MDNQILSGYLGTAINKIIEDVIRNTIKNPKETAFFMGFGAHLKKNEANQKSHEKKGYHIPSFLIASITSSCNLHCKGCYARENGICTDNQGKELSAHKWAGIFDEAVAMGISFVMLAGGEPLTRRDIIEKAAAKKNIIFPIFTNGTLIDNDYVKLFDANRNLVPILSIEGDKETTDNRRGTGVFDTLKEKMALLKAGKILFGVSITVTTENIKEVTSQDFMSKVMDYGCRLVFFVEYVPVDDTKKHLAPTDTERSYLEAKQEELKAKFETTLFFSFPGDEKLVGGCLAAGRGFFHINPYGGAEPCPFSPFSDTNLNEKSLLDAVNSPFFKKLQEKSFVGAKHIGGCALFEREQEVKELLASE